MFPWHGKLLAPFSSRLNPSFASIDYLSVSTLSLYYISLLCLFPCISFPLSIFLCFYPLFFSLLSLLYISPPCIYTILLSTSLSLCIFGLLSLSSAPPVSPLCLSSWSLHQFLPFVSPLSLPSNSVLCLSSFVSPPVSPLYLSSLSLTLSLPLVYFPPLFLPSIFPHPFPSLCPFPLVSFLTSILRCLSSLSLLSFSPLSLSTLSFPLYFSPLSSPSLFPPLYV